MWELMTQLHSPSFYSFHFLSTTLTHSIPSLTSLPLTLTSIATGSVWFCDRKHGSSYLVASSIFPLVADFKLNNITIDSISRFAVSFTLLTSPALCASSNVTSFLKGAELNAWMSRHRNGPAFTTIYHFTAQFLPQFTKFTKFTTLQITKSTTSI